MKRCYLLNLLIVVPVFAGQIFFELAEDASRIKVTETAEAMPIPITTPGAETLKYDDGTFNNGLGIHGNLTPSPDQTYGLATYFILSEFGITEPRQVGSVLINFWDINSASDFRLYVWDNVSGTLMPNSHGTNLYVDMNATIPTPHTWGAWDLSAENILLPDTFWIGVCYNEITTPPSMLLSMNTTQSDTHTYGNNSGVAAGWNPMSLMGVAYPYGIRVVVVELSGVAERNSATPASFSFGLKNNPAKDRVVFNVTLPQDALISLRVYDGSGRLIDRVVTGRKAAGFHQIPWTAPNNAGVYFYVFEAPGHKEVGKLVLIQ